MGFPFGETIIRVRGAINTRTGVWTETSRSNIDGCAVDWASTAEQTGTEDAVQNNVVIYAPFGADVQAADRVLIRGRTFDVVGDPVDWEQPSTGWQPGTAIRVVEHRG